MPVHLPERHHAAPLSGPLRGLLLDVDQTLFDRRPAWAAFFVRQGVSEGSAAAWLATADPVGRRARSSLVAEGARRFGLEVNPATLDVELAAAFADHVALPQARRALLDAIAARMPVGVVTNGGSETQRAKLQALGLAHLPAVVSGEVGVEKPAASIFHLGVRALGLGAEAASAVLYVGDDPVRDVQAAAAAGLCGRWAGDNCVFVDEVLHVPFYAVRCGLCNLFTTTGAHARDQEQAFLSALARQASVTQQALGAGSFHRLAINEEQQRRFLIQSLLQVPGVDRARFLARFGRDVLEAFPELTVLEERGWLAGDDQVLRLTDEGLARSDLMGPWLVSHAVRASMETDEIH